MSTKTYNLSLTLGYSNSDQQRTYKFTDVDETVGEEAKAKIQAYNQNLNDVDKRVFIADDYDNSDPNNVTGANIGIVAAKFETIEETPIEL